MKSRVDVRGRIAGAMHRECVSSFAIYITTRSVNYLESPCWPIWHLHTVRSYVVIGDPNHCIARGIVRHSLNLLVMHTSECRLPNCTAIAELLLPCCDAIADLLLTLQIPKTSCSTIR